MNKIGRNDPCSCGSGLKYKKCCLPKLEKGKVVTRQDKVSEQLFVTRETARLQEAAAKKQVVFKVVGTFLFFSTAKGDAWLLEMTDQDALAVASGGTLRDVVIDETEETLEVSWTHSFEIKGEDFVTKAYIDDSEAVHDGCPALTIKNAIVKLKRQLAGQDLDSLHIRK